MLSVRCTMEDEKIIKTYAAAQGKNVSELLRELVMEKIEEEYNLKIIQEYLAQKEEMKLLTADEVEKDLGL
ncbi:DUF6290 family protein [Anoxynatronum sibiricum]|uniref:DUF6290 family protein n=2 Tax=Anoxynatronum sibiricum TaxID=210623 RepID=A0ABU9VQZ0_9CLOT